MAVVRNHPYGRFNFLVEIEGISVSFCEVALPTAEISVTDYREGADKDNNVRKIPGLTKYSNVVLRRGLAGSTDLWQWFSSTRDGDIERRKVTVTLLKEDREPVMKWTLSNCLPVRYVGPVMNARASDFLIEELELSVERIEIE